MSKKPREVAVTEGSSNVFADLGLPDSEELLAKAQLASTISDIIKGRHLTQTEAASVLGTTQPKVSNLVRGRLEGFSLERLALFLNMNLNSPVRKRSSVTGIITCLKG